VPGERLGAWPVSTTAIFRFFKWCMWTDRVSVTFHYSIIKMFPNAGYRKGTLGLIGLKPARGGGFY
jgi:hypothetical protein